MFVICGCNFARDRVLDASDIIDVKFGKAWGLGVKIESTLFLNSGIGVASLRGTREWYGRRSAKNWEEGKSGYFIHLGFAGGDGYWSHFGGPPAVDNICILGANFNAFMPCEKPPILNRFRFGGECVVFPVLIGLYFNAGQMVDFILGFFGFDIAGDDGVSKDELMNLID